MRDLTDLKQIGSFDFFSSSFQRAVLFVVTTNCVMLFILLCRKDRIRVSERKYHNSLLLTVTLSEFFIYNKIACLKKKKDVLIHTEAKCVNMW